MLKRGHRTCGDKILGRPGTQEPNKAELLAAGPVDVSSQGTLGKKER